jgi:hypothetical protein
MVDDLTRLERRHGRSIELRLNRAGVVNVPFKHGRRSWVERVVALQAWDVPVRVQFETREVNHLMHAPASCTNPTIGASCATRAHRKAIHVIVSQEDAFVSEVILDELWNAFVLALLRLKTQATHDGVINVLVLVLSEFGFEKVAQ